MNSRTALATLVACSALLVSAACGGTEEPPTPPIVEPVNEPDADYPPVPTPDELNAELMRGFDPSVPLAEKAELVQGAQADPGLIDQVAAAALANDAVIEITGVDDLGDGTLSAGTTVTLGGQANPGTLTFVAEDGVWKLSKDNACQIVGLAGLASAACPAA